MVLRRSVHERASLEGNLARVDDNPAFAQGCHNIEFEHIVQGHVVCGAIVDTATLSTAATRVAGRRSVTILSCGDEQKRSTFQVFHLLCRGKYTRMNIYRCKTSSCSSRFCCSCFDHLFLCAQQVSLRFNRIVLNLG